MARRKWFRVYHGLAADVTLAVAARKAGISSAEMVALWLCCLDCASQHETPGSLQGLDTEAVAMLLNLDEERIKAALTALRDKKRIDTHQRVIG